MSDNAGGADNVTDNAGGGGGAAGRDAALRALRWKKFDVLDQGYVCLVDVMGDDHAICGAARISYGAGTRSVSDDRALIRYLMRHRHTSPFEQAELKLLVQCPMDVWRQWIRHRMASVNEYSTRYSEAIDVMQATPPEGWRTQSIGNKQGSGGFVTGWPDAKSAVPESDIAAILDDLDDDQDEMTPGQYLSMKERRFHRDAADLYRQRLAFGVAREQARKDLPLSTYTRAYWKIDLHNLLHFLSLRMDAHAQKEIRDYANVIGRELVAPLFPLAWEAFCDYRLEAVTLTALDREAIRRLLAGDDAFDDHIENARERVECRAKLVGLGLAGA